MWANCGQSTQLCAALSTTYFEGIVFDCLVVPREGLEPSRLAAADFESAASTDSAISAVARLERAEGGGIMRDSSLSDKSNH